MNVKKYVGFIALLGFVITAQGQVTTAKPGSPSLDTAETHFPDHLYLMNEGTGTTLEDDGDGGDYDLTFHGTTGAGPDWGTDATHGDKLTFVAANEDYVDNTTLSGLSGTITACAVATVTAGIGARNIWAFRSSFDRYIRLLYDADEDIEARANYDGVFNNSPSSQDGTGGWDLICGRWSETQTAWSLNGAAWVTGGSNTLTGLISGLTQLRLGASVNDVPNNFFNNAMIAAWWWAGSKSNAEISAIYNSGNPWPIIGVDAAATPVITAGPAVSGTTTKTITTTFTVDTTGNVKATACLDGQGGNEAETIAGQCTGGGAAPASWTEAVVATVGDSHQFTGLTQGTEYDLTFIFDGTVDSSLSILQNQATQSVAYTAGPTLTGATTTTLPFVYTVNQNGTDYLAVCTNGQTVTSFANLKAGTCSGGAAVAAASDAATANVSDTVTGTGLTSATIYDCFLGHEDSEGSQTAVISRNDCTTTGGSITFTSGPGVAATTNGYTISGTITCTGTCTVEAVGCNPGDGAPNNTELEAGQCGGGNTAVLNAQENWVTGVGNDFTLTGSGKPPVLNVYVAGTNGTVDTSVSTFADSIRSADSGQTIKRLTSVSATSPFAVQTVAGCDTHNASTIIDGCGDTSWVQAGMKVDLSAGFADLTDIIVEDVSNDTITLENAANATSSDITVTQDAYYTPGVAVSDTIEGDLLTSAGEAVTIEADGDISFTPTAATYRTWSYNVQDYSNATDGNFTSGPTAWATGVAKFQFFGTRPGFAPDLGDTPFLFYKDVALSGVSLTCTDDDSQITSITPRTSAPTGTSISSAGAWTGTPTVQNEAGAQIVLDCANEGLLYATPTTITYYVTDDVVVAPDVVNDPIATAVSDMNAVRPWLNESAQLVATYSYHATTAAGNVISQSPTAGNNLTALQLLSVTVSLGPAPVASAGASRRTGLGIGIP